MGKVLRPLAQLGLTIAGSAIGGTGGAAVGSMIGAMLFAQPQQPGASRVLDLKAQVSEPSFLKILCGGDVPDPDIAGRMLDGGVTTAGIVIAVSPNGGISRVPKKSKKKKKGGTGGRLFGVQGVKEYEHFLSFAVGWCEGSLEHPKRLLELRADEDLVYRHDAGPDEAGHIEMSDSLDALGNVVGQSSPNIRHYFGTETQLPDDIVQTWFEGGRAQAFRGVSYTTILNFQIDKFGHIPQFFARIGDGNTERIEQCRFFLLRCNGIDGEEILPPGKLNLSKISGTSRGWFMSQPGGTRAVAEYIAARSYCKLTEHSGGIYDTDLQNPTIFELSLDELGAEIEGAGESDNGGNAPPLSKRGLDEDLSQPTRVEVRFSDIRKKSDENTVKAQLQTAEHENVQTYDIPTVDTEEEMQAWAETMLDATWVGRMPLEVSLLMSRVGIVPGDVIRVPKRAQPGQFYQAIVEKATLGTPGVIGIEGRSWNRETFANRPRVTPTARPETTLSWAAPRLFVAHPPALSDADPDTYTNPICIVAATQGAAFEWGEGALVNIDRPRRSGTLGGEAGIEWDEDDEFEVRQRAVMGELAAPWMPGSPYDFSYGSTVGVEMFFGDLQSATEQAVRAGANVLLFESGLLVSFVTATQVAQNGFLLGGARPGRWGSDDFIQGQMPVGSRFVLLVDAEGAESSAISVQSFKAGDIGARMRLRSRMLSRLGGSNTREFNLAANNVFPPSPVGIRATRTPGGGLNLSGRARTRILDDGAWRLATPGEMSEKPGRAGFAFTLTLQSGGSVKKLTKYSEDDQASFAWTWSAAELSALFGAAPGALTGTVAMQGRYGLGRARSWSEI